MNILFLYADSLLRLAWLSFLLYWVLAAQRVKQTARREPVASRLLHLAAGVVAFSLLFSRQWRIGVLSRPFIPHTPGVVLLGPALVYAGLGFAVWARLHLGSNWSATVTIKSGHQLIRSGPYAIVRNPIYCGLLLAMLGTALFVGEAGGLLGLAIWLGTTLRKIKNEERFLSEQFGAEYAQYRSSVPGLIPYLL